MNFLPCKFVVREDKGKVTIEMIRPTDLIRLLNNNELTQFALKIENQLLEVVNNIK